MRAVIQRVSGASVTIDGQVNSKIDLGLMVLLGIEPEDDKTDIEWLSRKIVNMRIFDDEDGNMNLSLKEVDGDILLISQFTLHASTKKGNRPSFIRAAKPDTAIPLYEQTKETLKKEAGREIQTGEFGAHMEVALVNDGPVTIWLDTKNKE